MFIYLHWQTIILKYTVNAYRNKQLYICLYLCLHVYVYVNFNHVFGQLHMHMCMFISSYVFFCVYAPDMSVCALVNIYEYVCVCVCVNIV